MREKVPSAKLPVPKFRSDEEAAEYFETRSVGEVWDHLPVGDEDCRGNPAPQATERVTELRDGDLRLELASYALQPVHHVPAYSFRMIHAVTGEELGTIRLRVGSTRHVEMYAGHIGYAVHEAHRGHRYAARSVRLLLPLARRLGLDPLWITCDPENAASRRSLELAGATLVEIVDVPPDCVIHQSGHPRKCRYWLSTACDADHETPQCPEPAS